MVEYASESTLHESVKRFWEAHFGVRNMNVQPNPLAASVAGTARAQSRGSDTENVSQQNAGAARAESPGKATDGDQLSIDPSGASEDRGGDGRQVYEVTDREASQESSDEQSNARQSASVDDAGSELDFEA